MKVRLMIIIGVISFLLGGCNKIQKNSNQVQLVQRTEEILVESEDLADDYFHIYKERWNQSNRNSLKLQQDIIEYLGRKNYIAVDINKNHVIDFQQPDLHRLPYQHKLVQLSTTELF